MSEEVTQKKPYIRLLQVISFLVVVGITIFVFLVRDRVEEFAVYGYLGIFIISFLTYATVILPTPGIAVVFTMGAVFHPLLVGLTAGFGASLGELSGYLAGFSGRSVFKNFKYYDLLHQWIERRGALTIFLLSVIPNPLFDIAGITAGALRMPIISFYLSTLAGEIIKMLMFAYFGDSLGSLLG